MDRIIFFKGVCYLKPDGVIDEETPFVWGNQQYSVGNEFKQIGSKSRSQLKFMKPLVYKGYYDENYLFEIKDVDHKGYYVAASKVNECTLLMQSSDNGFWDIKY